MIKAPKFPFLFNDSKGFLDTSSIKEIIHFHLTNLFMTNPGERISDEEYGIGIKRYLFENGVDSILGEIEDEIIDQIGRYLPYIELNAVDVGFREEQNSLSISLAYKILDTAENDVISFEISTFEQENLTYWGEKYAIKTKYSIHEKRLWQY